MAIRIDCEKCGYQYKLKDELAGKKVKCKICKSVFIVPKPAAGPEVVDITGHGDPVYKYGERPTQFELAIGDSENIEQISQHIERHCGPIDGVMHELVSDLVHIDIHTVKPTRERPYHTLVTSGMSDRPMQAPAEVSECQFAELMICLPPDWPLDEKSWENPRFYWPIYLLKMLARFPHEYQTWLWWGHTMPNGDPAEPYADNTQLCCALLLTPLRFGEEFNQLDVGGGKTIHFFSIVPIYQEEIAFKLNSGAEALCDRFDKHQITELLNPQRVNVCKKKGWW